MKKLAVTLSALALMMSLLSGCYTTRVYEEGVHPSTDPRLSVEERQWFILAGAVPLSPPAGRECSDGLSWVESRTGVVDMLISIGLGVAGGLIVTDVTQDPTAGTAAASLVPALLGTRTVKYVCRSR